MHHQSLRKFKELVEVDVRLFQNVSQRRTLHRSVRRNSNLQDFVARSLLKADMASPLPDDRPTAYLVMLLDKKLNDRADFDAGIAAQTILLGATAAGFGGCIVRTVNRYAISRYFNLEENLEVMMVLALGKPKQTVEIKAVENASVAYYTDENDVHVVPKRLVDELIWQRSKKS